MDKPGVVEQLAGWVLAARAEDLAPPVVDQAKLLLLDTIGCGFAALHEPSARVPCSRWWKGPAAHRNAR